MTEFIFNHFLFPLSHTFMTSRKVFIIDDEKDFCLLMKNYFEKKHYEVETFYLLSDGLKAIENQGECTVFLDNNLPDGLGWEKISDLVEQYPDIHLHLLSGYHYTNISFPKDAYIKMWQKPISFSDLDKSFK